MLDGEVMLDGEWRARTRRGVERNLPSTGAVPSSRTASCDPMSVLSRISTSPFYLSRNTLLYTTRLFSDYTKTTCHTSVGHSLPKPQRLHVLLQDAVKSEVWVCYRDFGV